MSKFLSTNKIQIINNLSYSRNTSCEEACRLAVRELGLPSDTEAFVFRRSLDARHKNDIKYLYSVAVRTDKNDPRLTPLEPYMFTPDKVLGKDRPHIIGMGPAGLFCAYLLAKFGLHPVLIERGKPVEERTRDIERFQNGGELDENSNVQFGEGGAGTFSDGKLVTRINDPRTREVLQIFADHGAPRDILYEAKPHIGTDVLKDVLVQMRRDIVALGGEIHFNTHLDAVTVRDGRIVGVTLNGQTEEAHTVVLATGNGARDTYRMVLASPAATEAKPFSVGFRMEHLQSEIGFARYGKDFDKLPAADYSFSAHYPDGSAAYTFCMCPGGQVIHSASEKDAVVTNGMSNRARDGRNANAALLCPVSFSTPEAGMDFQRRLEHTAFLLGNGAAPVTLQKDFLNGTVSSSFGSVRPTVKPGTVFANFADIFPPDILHTLQHGVSDFSRRILNRDDAVLTAPETRTSAPLRILRDTLTLQSTTVQGLYPCGEGAGYAGGITSSAADGLRVAEKIICTGV